MSCDYEEKIRRGYHSPPPVWKVSFPPTPQGTGPPELGGVNKRRRRTGVFPLLPTGTLRPERQLQLSRTGAVALRYAGFDYSFLCDRKPGSTAS